MPVEAGKGARLGVAGLREAAALPGHITRSYAARGPQRLGLRDLLRRTTRVDDMVS